MATDPEVARLTGSRGQVGPRVFGRGLGSEATRLILGHAFDRMSAAPWTPRASAASIRWWLALAGFTACQ